jgi:hypothetical protein
MDNQSLKSIQSIHEENQSSLIVKKNCKLCNSSHRHEAESLYVETNNISSVYRFLKSKQEEVSVPAIRAHLLNHFVDHQRQEKIQQYAEDIIKWKQIEASKTERLSTYLAIIEKRIFELAAVSDQKIDSESVKITDTIAKLITQASDIQSKIDEEHKKLEPAKIILKKLKEIVEIKVKSSKTQDVKNVLVELVSDLQESLGGLLEND